MLRSLGVGRVARSPVMALVEGKKDGLGAGESRRRNFTQVLVDGHVGGAAPGCGTGPPWGSRDVLVLLDCVIDLLLGEIVLELEGQDGEAVDEQHEVQGELWVPGAVVDLPGHGEAVLGVEGCG